MWDVGETWGFFFSFTVASRPQTSFFSRQTRGTKTSDWTPVGVLGVLADPWGAWGGGGAPHEYLTVLCFPLSPLKAALQRERRKGGGKKKLIQMLQRWSSQMKSAALMVQKTHELKPPAR